MFRVGAGVEILGEQLLPLKIGLDAALEGVEPVHRHALVDLAPPDVGGDRGFIDHELVLDRATGMGAGFHHEGAITGQPALSTAQRCGDQRGRGLIGMNRAGDLHPGSGQRFHGMFFP